jgi:hypothetical protein
MRKAYAGRFFVDVFVIRVAEEAVRKLYMLFPKQPGGWIHGDLEALIV